MAPWMRYFCYQQEIAPTTGRHHWQAYVYVDPAQSLSAIRKKMAADYNRPHIEVARASIWKNREYCSKSESSVPDTFREHGTVPSQGERTDIKRACEEVLAGGLANVTDDTMIVKYHRGLEKLEAVRASKRPCLYRPPRVIWLHGPTGTGKTKAAYDHDPCLYHQTSTDGWFDHYFGQRTVLIDDLDPETFKLRDLLLMLDGYKYYFKVKGCMVPRKCDTIFITSHHPPQYYIPHDRWPEVRRRITEIRDTTLQDPVAGA